MEAKMALALLAEVVWGTIVAVALQFGGKFGRWLDKEMTWLPALIGTGVAGLIAAIYLGWRIVGLSALLLTAAFVPLFARAIVNLYRKDTTVWGDTRKVVDENAKSQAPPPSELGSPGSRRD